MQNEILRTEVWECRACGGDAPCRVAIVHADLTPGRQKFVRQVCLTGNQRDEWAEWEMLSNETTTRPGIRRIVLEN